MPQASNTFRIFVSSTFDDFKVERDALQKYVFPKLRELCVHHGRRFQAVDLRWGVSEEASLDQQTMKICLEEIGRCQKSTPRPNFIVLLGERYGWRPLPAEIPADEFEQIVPHISRPQDRNSLVWEERQSPDQKGWYRKDDNAVPPVYRLRPREIKSSDNQTDEEKDAARQVESDRWGEIERALRQILLATIDKAPLKDEQKWKYLASATEKEIAAGALRVADAREHVFCFFRHFKELPLDTSARDFIDLEARAERGEDQVAMLDEEARQRLEKLKAELRRALPETIYDYETEWKGIDEDNSAIPTQCRDVLEAITQCLDGLANEKLAASLTADDWDHLKRTKTRLLRERRIKQRGDAEAIVSPISLTHLSELCVDVYLALAKVILEEVSRIEESDPLDKEIESHKAFGAERIKFKGEGDSFFVGRAEHQNSIADYLNGADSHPRVLFGDAGSGKTALMARAFEQVRRANPGATVIVRFIGATPDSPNDRALLESLCKEIARSYGENEQDIPTEYQQLVEEFPHRLQSATEDKPLIIFLDALDQLADRDSAHSLAWLPEKLPAHVRVVISTLPGERLSQLERKLPAGNFLRLDPMTTSEGGELLDLWLAEAGRRLQPSQRAAVLKNFSVTGLPLYLKLAFEEARRWNSYDPPSHSPADARGMFRATLRRLAADHGSILVARALSYVAAARHGLSEDELIDVLSRSHTVFKDFLRRSRHRPSMRRLPVVLWSRLYFDLEPYLTERSVDGANLLAFYHRQLAEVIAAEYFADGAEPARHRELARYFGSQPLFLEKEAGRTPNARKVSELPHQQAKAFIGDELTATLCDLRFLDAKCRAGMIWDLVADYDAGEHLLSHHAESQTELWGWWRAFLRKHAQRLLQNPNMLVALTNHEGTSDLRAQAAGGSWPSEWLRTSPEPMPPQPAGKGFRAQVTGSYEFHRSQLTAPAANRSLAFCFGRMGTVRVVDARRMLQLDSLLSIRRERPLLLACDPDAVGLAVFYESGEAELYRCASGAEEPPVALVLEAVFPFHLPECEDPVAVWHNGSLWFQSRPDALARVSLDDAKVKEETLPAGASGELSALVFLEGARLIGLRRDGDSVLLPGGAPPLRVRATDICAACGCGEQTAAVAFTNGAVVVYDLAAGFVRRAEARAGIIRGALAWDGERLLWFGEDHRFCAWRPGEPAAMEVQDNQQIFPKGLHVCPRHWLRTADGAMLLITTHGVVSFRLAEGGVAPTGRIESLLGGGMWRVVRKQGREQWLIEGPPPREVPLGFDVKGRLYCALDGRGHFFAATGYGPGLLLDLATLEHVPLQDCPPGVNLAAGDPEVGCWFTDREGDIYFAAADGRCALAARIGLDKASGAQIYMCGEHLIWYGFSYRWFADTGTESARTFVFFRRHLKPEPRLERLGECFFAVREGLCEALAYDAAHRRLVAIWLSEGTKSHLLRVAGVEDFIAGRYEDRALGDVGPLGQLQAALSPDGHWLVVINTSGKLSCVRVADGQVVAGLAGSSPFTRAATGASGAEFWLVEAHERVYRCALIPAS